jgi:hypothetical protein
MSNSKPFSNTLCLCVPTPTYLGNGKNVPGSNMDKERIGLKRITF